jgi:hypothetical protein
LHLSPVLLVFHLVLRLDGVDSLISCLTASHSLTGCCRLVETPYYRQADEFSGIFLGKSQGLYWQGGAVRQVGLISQTDHLPVYERRPFSVP